MSKLFQEDSYWYFQRNRNTIDDWKFVEENEAKDSIKRMSRGIRENFRNGKINPSDTPIDFIRDDTVYKGGKEIKVREGKDYLYPIILFAKNGKLMVKGTHIIDESEEIDELRSWYSYTLDKDFVLGDYDMDDDIRFAIKKRFGLQPIALHYIGPRLLHSYTRASNEEGIPRIYDDEDDEYPDEEGYIDVDSQDVLLCTEWEGKINIPLEEGEELMFVEPNKFYHPKYSFGEPKPATLLEALTLDFGSYYVWGNLLYHLVGWEKMQIK